MERRPVPGWEGLYEVTSTGRVFAMPRAVVDRLERTRWLPGSERTPTPDGKGYLCVPLYRNNHGTNTRVHRLVALAFLGPPPTDRHEVRHLDGDPTNNNVSNLAWGTPEENHADQIRHGRWKQPPTLRGEDVAQAKLTEAQVLEMRALYAAGARQVDLAERFGVRQITVSAIVRRKTWKHI